MSTACGDAAIREDAERIESGRIVGASTAPNHDHATGNAIGAGTTRPAALSAVPPSLHAPPLSLDVVWGVAGDVVQIEHERHMLWTKCELVICAYFCRFCRQYLANVAQLEMHLERGGQHYLVRHCTRHGYEACEDPREVRTHDR